MGKIIAIGGGEIKDKDTLSIDRQILELTGKSAPRLLFIPTASSDAEGYCSTVENVFGIELGAQVDFLKLISENPSDAEIYEKILSADAIYVGGGNTQKMLDKWQERGVNVLLKKAFENDIVLSGLSAGAICWFEFGSTDSPRFDNPADTEFVLIKGLGFAKGLLSPHHIREPRRIEKLPQLVRESGCFGIGVDDNAALEIIDDHYRVLASKQGAAIEIFHFEKEALRRNRIETFDSPKLYAELSLK